MDRTQSALETDTVEPDFALTNTGPQREPQAKQDNPSPVTRTFSAEQRGGGDSQTLRSASHLQSTLLYFIEGSEFYRAHTHTYTQNLRLIPEFPADLCDFYRGHLISGCTESETCPCFVAQGCCEIK